MWTVPEKRIINFFWLYYIQYSILLCFSSNKTTFYLDPALLPKIQYVSLLLDTDSDKSSDLDAVAMKYLNDEELTKLAQLHTGKKVKNIPYSPSKGVSTFGMSANDMTFSTKNYLERYGLIKGEGQAQGQGYSEVDDSQKSFMKVQNLLEGFYQRTSRENSCNSSQNTDQLGDSINGRLNLGQAFDNNEYGAAKFEVYHQERQDNAKRQLINGHRKNSVNSSSNSSEHSSTRGQPANRILDIDRLKELPKLL